MIGNLIGVPFNVVSSDVFELVIGECYKMSFLIFEHFLPDTICVAAFVAEILNLHLTA